MVAQRRRNLEAAPNSNDDQDTYRRDDLESAIPPESPRSRFKDVVHRTIDAQKAQKLKEKLRSGIDRKGMEQYRKSQEELKRISNKKVKKFYQEQNERLNDLVEIDHLVMSLADDILDSMNPQDMDNDGICESGGALQRVNESIEPLLPDDERQRRRKGRRNARWAVNINVIANILLLLAKCIAAAYSDSLSLIASLVDSALDLLCTLIVWTTTKLVSWKLHMLKAKFPVGRRRLEPLGILVFSIIMIVSFVQILQESVTKLLPGGDRTTVKLPPIAIAAMASTVGVKGIIWIGCARIKTTQVEALAKDCKTDVFFNTLSLLFPVIGHQLNVWWLDPAGAAILSLFIIYDWAETSFENITRLMGAAASERLHQKVMYMAWRFAPLVKSYKSLKAYHAGDGVWVELDVLMDEKTPLRQAHDVAETLQYCCEGLGEVDRAFVTVDYAWQGPTGHVAE
ncbi:hypothetical protein M501DRAFT_956775 [Patellaria atrata CBS 101060]|uniref:Cation efflux protein transmembrane domain-containing protein n=1 Tax=Patellaria atrata CBS 101060 TaxID=1346257 RepID=A0A9P4SB29_9PEZI|nr:hypothetical protein M501DRAFT_956775 [Patellaria atrata CBS 101060]